jgi:hypothetical protein
MPFPQSVLQRKKWARISHRGVISRRIVTFGVAWFDVNEYKDLHILIRSDNKGAIGAHQKGRCPNADINLCARRSFALAAGNNITPNIVYVPSADNLADAPSRGLPSGLLAADRMPRTFQLPAELRKVFVGGDKRDGDNVGITAPARRRKPGKRA